MANFFSGLVKKYASGFLDLFFKEPNTLRFKKDGDKIHANYAGTFLQVYRNGELELTHIRYSGWDRKAVSEIVKKRYQL